MSYLCNRILFLGQLHWSSEVSSYLLFHQVESSFEKKLLEVLKNIFFNMIENIYKPCIFKAFFFPKLSVNDIYFFIRVKNIDEIKTKIIVFQDGPAINVLKIIP